jgi:hypothetical protein
MSVPQNVRSAKRPFGKTSVGKMSVGKMSVRQNVFRQNVFRQSVFRQNVRPPHVHQCLSYKKMPADSLQQKMPSECNFLMAGRLKRFLSLFHKHWPKAKEIPNSTCSHLYEFSVLRGCHGE